MYKKKLSPKQLLKKTITETPLQNNVCEPLFTCKKCKQQWEPDWDENGDFLLQSYFCPNGCNK